MKNKYKLLFFLLLGINGAIIISILILITIPAKEERIDSEKKSMHEEAVHLPIQTNKADLNEVINHYLDKEGLTGPIHYEVKLDDDVELYGTLRVFSKNIEMKLTFEPEALENGDLILRQKSIAIGELNLPVSYVLKFIQDRYHLPKWVKIQPNDKIIYVSMQNMELKSDIKLLVNTFDLQKDDISFTLLVPTK
ncbi:YpmS family protein [Bacillus aquiflavi]|uniref:YpmS family protein n=1 Tax=Bacillus aquiflavi TaxID=2672567 RepID=A0A6B3W296_9BACI|nr:YpmS family protein [Bacillus aquiflavi]MBA4537770.1 YpmS family protein [Bacillus aquiflavi]NEY82026.1 YpmS family protein [Bacillus aquiflavi]UAC46952.1 YpmS family protein [Bacillus aquiflavi]